MSKPKDEVLDALLSACVRNASRLDGLKNEGYESPIKADEFGYHRGYRLIRILLLLDELSHATDDDDVRYNINRSIWCLTEALSAVVLDEYPAPDSEQDNPEGDS